MVQSSSLYPYVHVGKDASINGQPFHFAQRVSEGDENYLLLSATAH